jgi:hypothetical protein
MFILSTKTKKLYVDYWALPTFIAKMDSKTTIIFLKIIV